jgi:hypothetical protein
MLNIQYSNLSNDELICEAEYTNNELALAISKSSIESAREELEIEYDESTKIDNGEVISKSGVADIVKFLYTEASWEKEDSRSEWYIDGFKGDFNCSMNHIGVIKDGIGYTAFVKYGPYGEMDKELRVPTLKGAKSEAINLAVEAAGEGLLLS